MYNIFMEIIKAKVEKLLLTRPFDAPCIETKRLEILLDGITNDRHYGRSRNADSRTKKLVSNGIEVANLRAVTIVSAKELAYVSEQLGFEVLPEDLEANITLSGVENLSQTAPGTYIRFPGNAILFVTAENIPCAYPAENMIARGMPKEKAVMFSKVAMGKRGLTALIFAAGRITVGDEADIIPIQLLE